MAVALTMKEAVLFSNLILKLGFDESFGNVLVYIDSTSALHAADNRTCPYSFRAKFIALRYFFVQKLVKEGNISIPCVKTEDHLANLGSSNVTTISIFSRVQNIKRQQARHLQPGGRYLPAGGVLAYSSCRFCALCSFFIDMHVHCTALSQQVVIISWCIFFSIFVISCKPWTAKLVRDKPFYCFVRC